MRGFVRKYGSVHHAKSFQEEDFYESHVKSVMYRWYRLLRKRFKIAFGAGLTNDFVLLLSG